MCTKEAVFHHRITGTANIDSVRTHAVRNGFDIIHSYFLALIKRNCPNLWMHQLYSFYTDIFGVFDTDNSAVISQTGKFLATYSTSAPHCHILDAMTIKTTVYKSSRRKVIDFIAFQIINLMVINTGFKIHYIWIILIRHIFFWRICKNIQRIWRSISVTGISVNFNKILTLISKSKLNNIV